MMKLLRNRPIGVFDSGVGGLTVVKNIRKCLPNEDIVYFGDTARVPYGNKSKSTIIRFANEIMAFMIKSRVKMVVVACNTASSLSLASLKRSYAIPVLGVISPGLKEAVRVSSNKRIGVIGTNSTISSSVYDKELARYGSSYRLFSKSCSLFVHLVESGFINDAIACQAAQKYLHALKKKKIDTLILGCTHYPILKTVIGKVMKGTKLVDSSFAAAKEVKNELLKNNLEVSHRNRQGKMKCYVSDDVKGFCKIAEVFLREKVNVKKVVL